MAEVIWYDNEWRSSEGLGDGFFGNCFLDTHIKLTGESDTWAVDFSQNVDIFFVLIPVEDEIGSPDEGNFFFLESIFDHGEFC